MGVGGILNCGGLTVFTFPPHTVSCPLCHLSILSVHPTFRYSLYHLTQSVFLITISKKCTLFSLLSVPYNVSSSSHHPVKYSDCQAPTVSASHVVTSLYYLPTQSAAHTVSFSHSQFLTLSAPRTVISSHCQRPKI